MQATKRNFVMKSEISPVPRGLKSQYHLPLLPCYPAPQNAVLCPKICQLLSLEDFLLLPCIFSSIPSFSIKHATPQKKRRLSHLTINSYYFSLKAHRPPQLVPAESVRGAYGKARRSRRPCNCRALLEYLQQYCKETSEKRVTEYSLGYGKSGLSRKGCLLGSSACGDQEWQGNDLECNLVFNWASGAQGHRAPFAACVEQAQILF